MILTLCAWHRWPRPLRLTWDGGLWKLQLSHGICRRCRARVTRCMRKTP